MSPSFMQGCLRSIVGGQPHRGLVGLQLRPHKVSKWESFGDDRQVGGYSWSLCCPLWVTAEGGATPLILFSASLERQVEALGTSMGHKLSALPTAPRQIPHVPPGDFSVRCAPSLRWEEGSPAGAFWESWVPSPPWLQL